MQLPHITFIQQSKYFYFNPIHRNILYAPNLCCTFKRCPSCCYCSNGKTSLSIWRSAFAPSIVPTSAKIGPGWAEVPTRFKQQEQKCASTLSVKEGDLCPLWAETRQMLENQLGLTLGCGMQCLLVSICISWLS